MEVRYFRLDGGYRWVEASTRSVRDEHGRLSGTTGTLRDVTERRAADEERRRLATNIRQLLDASGEGIVGLDARGTVTFINQRGSEMLGYAPDELVGRLMHEAVHYSRPDGTAYPARRLSHPGVPPSSGMPCEVDDEVLWRKDGIALRVEYAASPVREQGRVSGAVVNFRDITARKRAELELHRRARCRAGGQPRQERFPGAHEPRAAHPAQLHHRLRQRPAQEQAAAPRGGRPLLPQPHREQRRTCSASSTTSSTSPRSRPGT